MSIPLNARDVLLQSTSPRFFNEAGQDGLNSATIFIYQRNNTGVAPTLPSVSTTYTYATGEISGLNNGWSSVLPDASVGKYLFLSRAIASSVGTTDTLASLDWAAAQLLAQDGAPGLNTATITLYQRSASATPLSKPSANVTYTFATGGISGLSNGWSSTIPTTGGAYLHTTSGVAIATTATDTILPSEWTTVKLMYDAEALIAAQAAADAAQARAELAEVQAKAYADGIVDAEESRAIADAAAKAEAARVAAVNTAAADATAKANAAKAAAETYAQAQANLARTTAEAHADGIVDAEEARAIADATAKAEAARVAAVNAAAADATAKANVAALTANTLFTQDLGDGTHFGARNRVDAPGEYPMGTVKHFKTGATYGFTSTSGYFALETFKQYPDATGGGVYQYAYVDLKTYRRWSANGNGNNSTWNSWVLDLDRNAYTGDLNASNDVSLVASGSGLVVLGNSVSRAVSAGWTASVRSLNANTGASSCSFTFDMGSSAMAGLNSDPLTNDSFNTIDYSWFCVPDGRLLIYFNGVPYNNDQVMATHGASTDVLGVMMDGSTVIFTHNGVVKLALSTPSNPTLAFDSSIEFGAIRNIRFNAIPSNNFDAVGGPNKPQNGATVGAPAGTPVAGVDAATVVANAAAGAGAASALANPPTLNNVDNINGNIATGGGLKTITTLYPTTTGGTAPFAYTVALAYGDMADMPITITKSSTGGNTDNVIAFKCLGFSSGMVTNGTVTVTSRDAKGQLAIKVIDFYVQTF